LNKRILAICDTEADYAYRMVEVLKARKDLNFDIHVFTDLLKLLSFGLVGEIECLLITESAYEEKIKELNIPHVFVLNETGIEKSDNFSREENHFYNINKYQAADNIVNDMLAYYVDIKAVLPRKILQNSKSAKIIGVYSPVKRCLQTTFSLTLGQILAKQGKALYLNYESFSGFGKITGRNFRADITDMMYLFECVKEKFIYKLSTITEQVNGLDFVAPAAVYPDLMNIPGKKWTELLNELREQSNYEYIILDLTDYVDGLLHILNECDWIYTITKGDFYAAAKIEQYEYLLTELKLEDVMTKTKKLSLPIFKNIPLKHDEMTYSELAAYIREKLLDDLCK
jgi:cellulose biosynthesis protein BcsQ